MSSVREIASKLGVSVATVSRVINNDPRVSDAMRERVLKAANQSRYVPKVGTKSTMNIALLYTDEPSLESPFDSALMQGMGERMDEFGFDLMILRGSRTRHAAETFTQMLMRKGVRGAVIRTTSRSRQACEEIATEGFPAIVVGDRFENPKVSFVATDSRTGSREAVDHLLKLGHRQIAVVTNIVDDSDHADRILGYTEALESAGLKPNPDLIVKTPANLAGGKQIIRRLMAGNDHPTAIYLVDPMAAVGALHELLDMGIKVPADVSLIGFDDGELRHLMQPTMTAVCQDAVELGRKAFEMLHDIITAAGKPPMLRRTLPTVLEIHGSTAVVKK
jgi:DNA-binding LacI/PurR family transcriptional regulator